ncbi:MAG: C10 family peptidase, partial [Candidatus Delongbacteria bacterium]|nr:C10 family peptidase [Candidatus Delongbacteria bacterium]
MKKMLLSVLVLAAMLSAAIVPVDRAKTVAENYYQNYAPTMSKGNVVVKTLTKEYMGQPTWYVFKFTKGFVIVAADDNVDPILGHSFDGIIDEDIYNMQNPFVARFSGYDKQIVHSIREKNLDRPAKQKEWKDIENNVFPNVSSKVQVGPLLQTKWGQGYPWNLQTPQQTYVGCVATAMHQIMRFHQGPTAGNGTHTDVDLSGDIQGSWTVNFGAATYDWSLMQGIYASDFDTEEKRNEVAELSYHCGIAVDMDYDSDGSGTQTSYVPAALENYFSFSTDAVYQTLGTVTDSSYFATTIQINLNQNRPIEWCGYPSTGAGHAFVLDGYKDGYWYSFNWGWSGSYDGWFKINDLTPGVNDFTFNQGCAHTLYVNGLLAQMPPPQNLAQSVSTDGDVTLTWNAPTTVDPMGTLIDYAIYRDRELIAYKGDLVRSYVDPAMPEGDYLYTVRAVYENPDGESLISNEVTAVVSPDPGFPVPIAFSATSYQFVRSKIDLAWTKPFVGTALFQDGFETGNTAGQPPVGWTQRRS